MDVLGLKESNRSTAEAEAAQGSYTTPLEWLTLQTLHTPVTMPEQMTLGHGPEVRCVCLAVWTIKQLGPQSSRVAHFQPACLWCF